tara:strand:+ start:331 stop:2550 length:2220 start_codon:yes stop_codon:yes gene_type:complete
MLNALQRRRGNWCRAALLTALLIVLTITLGGSNTPDILVDFDKPSTGLARELDFKLGTNELFDLYRDGGIDRTSQLGSDLVRVWVGHRFLGTAVQSSTTNDIDWELLHTFVQKVLDSGAEPLISFVSPPQWIFSASGAPSSQHESESLDNVGNREFGVYVANAIEQLKNRFGDAALRWPYQVWNEPNNHQNAGTRYACGQGSNYSAIYSATRTAVDSRFGRSVISLGGPSLDAIDSGAARNPSGTFVCGTASDLDWEAYLRAVDSEVAPDFLSWHWYGMFQIGETTPHDVLTNRLDWFEDRVYVTTKIANGRPNYIEEINLNGDLAVDPMLDEPINGAFLTSATFRAVRQGASGLLVYKGTRDPSGLSPRGEPDFGLWSSSLTDEPGSVFQALQLVRRFVKGPGQLARVIVQTDDLDALAIRSNTGPRLAVVNLANVPRTIRITGVAPGQYISTSATAPWKKGWFNGTDIPLPAYGLVVIANPIRGLPSLPTTERGASVYSSSCAQCHGNLGATSNTPNLLGETRKNIDVSHSRNIPLRDRIDIANVLSSRPHQKQHIVGSVRIKSGAPAQRALVIAAGSGSATSAWTDSSGAFAMKIPDPFAAPTSEPVQLVAIHPDLGSSLAPVNTHQSKTHTNLEFILASPDTTERPLVAAAFVVEEGQDVLRIGAGTAGTNLTVWAIDIHAGIAHKLQADPSHAFGLHQALVRKNGSATAGTSWVIVAINPSGISSKFVQIEAAS